MRRWIVTIFLILLLASSANVAAQEKEDKTLILSNSSFWRYHYTLKPPVVRKGEKLEKISLGTSKAKDGPTRPIGQWLYYDTPLPPNKWREVDFNDVGWHRKPLLDPDSPWVAHMALRGKFNVTEVGKAKGLKLTVSYRGGIVVYLNGREIARGHLKKDAAPDDLADDYPADEPKQVRELAGISLPGRALRKGTNVLSFEVHRSPQPTSTVKLVNKAMSIASGTCGVPNIRLTATGTDAVTPNETRPVGLQVWNSDPMSADYESDYGDQNEPLRPIRIVAPRGGVGSGKVVIGSKSPIKGLRAVTSVFKRKGTGGDIPVAAVQVRYALPTTLGAWSVRGRGVAPYRFDALEEVPPEEIPVRTPRIPQGWPERKRLAGAVVPVWVTVEVPAEAKAGDYRGNLTISIPNEKPIMVPVELKVCPWKVPEPTEYHMFVDVVQSPESVAMQYGLPMWSDEHFKLLEKSLKLLGQVGNDVCYIPLICDTNMGNDESMVRWVKQPDGSYKHDFTVMERYLDLVQKYQGKPRVACFYVWDTYLEGGLTGFSPNWGGNQGKPAMKEREEHKGKGPIVSLLDETTGKVRKHSLPMYRDPKSRLLWEPLMKEIRRRMKKRGLEGAMMLGCVTDQLPTKNVVEHFEAISPGIQWVAHSHHRFQYRIQHVPIGYSSTPYLVSSRLMFPVDPTVARMYGWQGKELWTHCPRNTRDSFCPTTWRFISEINATGKSRGFSRLGGDFFGVLKDKRGRTVGTLSARFPKTSWRMLNIRTALLAAGENGTIATARCEMMREGLQECEARIFIEKALLDKTERAKLGEQLAGSCQDLLDERTRNMLRAASTLQAKGRRLGGYCYASGNWWNQPPVLGSQWFVSSDWQSEIGNLYEAAAQVGWKLKEELK